MAPVKGTEAGRVVKDFSGWKVTEVFGDKPLDVTKDFFFTRMLASALNSHLEKAHRNDSREKINDRH